MKLADSIHNGSNLLEKLTFHDQAIQARLMPLRRRRACRSKCELSECR
jgi:hypothetical protein